MAKRATKSSSDRPKRQPLPGMATPKVKRLHEICEGIEDARTRKNEAAQEESSLIASALPYMQEKDLHFYTAHGVTLTRTVVERVNAKLTKAQGDAVDSPAEEDDDAPAFAE